MENFEKIIDSFELRNNLNPKIWDNSQNTEDAKLKPKVRKALINISEEFAEYLGGDFFIEDVVLTGSLSNFNWSPYSDFDLHLIVDFKQFENEAELKIENFNLKKQIFNEKHNIKIYGYDVELYAQDESESHFASGVFSIMNNEWVTIPKKEDFTLDRPLFKKKVKQWLEKINRLIKDKENLNYKRIELLKDKLKNYRKSGLEKKGEFSYENLTFKFLRRSGHIKKLFDASNIAIDKKLSVEQFITEEDNDFSKYTALKSDLENFLNNSKIVKDFVELYKNEKVLEYTPNQKETFSEDVESLQKSLVYLGFNLGKKGVDGKFGEETKKAVEKFQEKNKLDTTGSIKGEDYKKLISQLYIERFSDDKIKSSTTKNKVGKKGKFTYLDMDSGEGFKIYKEICDSYINQRNPNAGITGEMLANSAKKYFSQGYVPPELALSQLAAEGGLSKDENAKPRRTKNPFNVGNTTSGKLKYHSNVQSGIDSYYDLLTRRYLVGGKTAEDLIQNFVNLNGHSYAGEGYEQLVRDVLNNVQKHSDTVLSKYSV